MRARTKVEFQKKHNTVVEITRKKKAEEMVQTGCEMLEKPPKALINTVAKKQWKIIVNQLKELDMISNLDMYSLICFCNAYANYEKAITQLKDEPYVGDDGKLNPLVNACQKFSDEMRKYAHILGLTLDSRLKTAHLKQEAEGNTISQRFGAI